MGESVEVAGAGIEGIEILIVSVAVPPPFNWEGLAENVRILDLVGYLS